MLAVRFSLTRLRAGPGRGSTGPPGGGDRGNVDPGGEGWGVGTYAAFDVGPLFHRDGSILIGERSPPHRDLPDQLHTPPPPPHSILTFTVTLWAVLSERCAPRAGVRFTSINTGAVAIQFLLASYDQLKI